MTQTSNPKPRQQRLRTRDFLAPVIGGFVLLVLLQAFVGRMYVIPSASMEPTLHGCTGCDNDRIAVQKLSYYFHDPAPGDVVVFEGPESWNAEFEVQRSENVLMRGAHNVLASVGLLPNGENILVKRVIATEGQTVKCEEGDSAVMVDGAPIDQSFTLDPPEIPVDPSYGSQACGGQYFGPVTVPESNLWVMGDNRTNSLDSRAHIGDHLQGTVPVANVRGKVEAVVLPVSRFGGVDDPDVQDAAA
ncbi:signal peptidase I [Corynebacterium macginleyi]|uniref:signal peptidase I n=1 Tax=Corynebacterium macginleyi TaxID=38290 RepID=UPI00190C74BC|nr:signal peptidase I [Corynebacterium macginleyi]MBK4145798.1 signal peptidase I [Corynebacterium macginleyi]